MNLKHLLLPRRIVGSPLALAIIFVVLLALIPIAVRPTAEFMGKDISGVAAGIVAFYPWAAVSEVLKIAGLSIGLTYLIFSVYSTLSRHIERRSWRLVVFPMTPVLAYGLWLVGSCLRYPALYETHLSESLRRIFFKLSFFVAPWMFFVLALACLVAPVLWGVFALGKRRAFGLLLIVTGLLGGVAYFDNWPYWSSFAYVKKMFHQESKILVPTPPNVLVIGIDSLRYDRLHKKAVTPALQSLLADEQTVSFEDHFVGVPRTFPSWVEIVQGKNAPQTGIRQMFPGFKQRIGEFKGMVTAFRTADYVTHVVSDFAGDIFPRFRAGFNKIDTPDLTLSSMIKMNVDQSSPLFLPIITNDLFVELFPDLKESPAFADPRQLTEKVLKAFKTKANDRPLFLTVFYSTAHFPYAAPFPHYNKFSSIDYDGAFLFQKNPELDGGTLQPEEKDILQMRALYDGAVNAIDSELERLFAMLKSHGEWNDTIIVVTADHGEDLYEPGMQQGHGEHLRGDHVLHTPWILKLAGKTPVVKGIPWISRSIDIAPTVMSAAGLKGAPTSGHDWLPFILGQEKSDPNLEAYSETGIWFSKSGRGFFQKNRLEYPGISGLLNFDQGFSGEVVLNQAFEKMLIGSRHRSLIAGDYKMILEPTPEGIKYELYNRRLDPESKSDLFLEQTDVADRMKKKLLELIRKMEPKASYYDDFVVSE